MSLKYKGGDAGELFMRHRLLAPEIDRARQAAMDCTEPEKSHFLFGRLAAMMEYADTSHTKVAEKLIEVKQQAEEICGVESLQEELAFCRGWAAGLSALLSMDRTVFQTKGMMYIFVYAATEELAQKYRLALAAVDVLRPMGGSGRLQYMVSADADELLAAICPLEDTAEYALLVVYGKDHAPDLDTMTRLSDGTGERVYLLADKEAEINCAAIVKRILKSTAL